jgi:putrescine transport system ATP-binding protein
VRESLEVQGVRKSFGGAPVLRDVSFNLRARRTLAVLGRSGCGKTTLLRILAGLEPADAGRVVRDGEDITGLPVRARDVVYLYQEPLLFPHLSVFENVAFGLRLRETPAHEVTARVGQMLDSLELAGLGGREPASLSGGQRQRVSFGRALIVRPSLLLLDEPFSSLDAETRAAMRALFKRVARTHALSALFVTHDLKEALEVGDDLGQIRDGRMKVYSSRAEFIADPESGVTREQEFWRTVEDRRVEPV